MKHYVREALWQSAGTAVVMSNPTSNISRIARAFLVIATSCALWPANASSAYSSVERVSFSERSDGYGYVIRIHSSEHVPLLSEPVISDDGSFQITLIRTSLSENEQRNEPLGPVRTYSVEQVGRDVVLTFELDHPDQDITAYRDRDTEDILIGLS